MTLLAGMDEVQSAAERMRARAARAAATPPALQAPAQDDPAARMRARAARAAAPAPQPAAAEQPAPAAAPAEIASSNEASFRTIPDKWMLQFSTLGVRDPVATMMQAIPIGDPLDNGRRLDRIGGGPSSGRRHSSSPEWDEEQRRQSLGGWLNESGIIDPSRLNELADRDPAMKTALASLRRIQDISLREAVTRTPEQIEENGRKLLEDISRNLKSGNPDDREFINKHYGIYQLGTLDMELDALHKAGLPGVHYPAMTDEDVAAELTSALQSHAAEELTRWQEENKFAATSANVLGSSVTFMPTMRVLSLAGRVAGLGRLTTAGRLGARLRMMNEGVAFGGADLAMQIAQKHFGARDDVDLTQAAVMGGTGALANALTEWAHLQGLNHMKGVVAREAARNGLQGASGKALELAASARLARSSAWKTGLGGLNISSQQLMATGINHARARIAEMQSGGTTKAPEIDWAVEAYSVLLNGLVGMADGALRGDKVRLEVGNRLIERAWSKARERLGKATPPAADPGPGPDVTFAEAQSIAEAPAPEAASSAKIPPSAAAGAAIPSGAASGAAIPEAPARKEFTVGAEVSGADQVRVRSGDVVEKQIAPFLNLPGGRSTMEMTAVADLQVRPEEMQFKTGFGERGVVAGERLSGDYQHQPARPLLILEKLDGSKVVVDGHHRYDLAVRTKTERVLTNTIREADGWTVQSARALGAIANIRDGAGTTRDYARFFANSDISKEMAQKEGLLSKAKGQAGWSIGRGAGKRLFNELMNDGITDAQAAAITDALPATDANTEAAQESVVSKVMAGKWTADRARAFAQQLAELSSATKKTATQRDMFGNSEADKTAIEQADKIAGELAAMRRETAEDIGSFKGAAKRPEKAGEHGISFESEQSRQQALRDLKLLEQRHADLGEAHRFPELMDEARERAGLPPKPGFEDVRAERKKKAERIASGEPEPGGLFGAKKSAPQPEAAARMPPHKPDAAEGAPKAAAAKKPSKPSAGKDAPQELAATFAESARKAAPRIAEGEASRKALREGKAPRAAEPTPEQSSFRTLIGDDTPTYKRVASVFEDRIKAGDEQARRVQDALDASTQALARMGHDPSVPPDPGSLSAETRAVVAARSAMLGAVSRQIKGSKAAGRKNAPSAERAKADYAQVEETLALLDKAMSPLADRMVKAGRLGASDQAPAGATTSHDDAVRAAELELVKAEAAEAEHAKTFNSESHQDDADKNHQGFYTAFELRQRTHDARDRYRQAVQDRDVAAVAAKRGEADPAKDADTPLGERIAGTPSDVPKRSAALVHTIGRQRSGVDTAPLSVDQLRDIDELAKAGEVDYIYDRAGRERLLDSRFPVPKGWRRESEGFATAASPQQVEAAKAARVAVDDGANTAGVAIDDAGSVLEGEAASLIAQRIADGTMPVRDSRKIGKEHGSYEVTLKDGKKIRFLIGDDAVRHLYAEYHNRLKIEMRRKREGGAVTIPRFYMPPALRKQLDAQHRRFVQSAVFGSIRRGLSATVRAIGAAVNSFNLRGGAKGSDWGKELQQGFERGMGWYADPKLEQYAREYDQALAIADRRIGETLGDIERIIRATPNGEYLMMDAFWALEGKPPQEWVPAEPGGRRNPKSKEMAPAPVEGELRPRTTVIKYDRRAAVAMARVIERLRDQFAQTGQKLVDLGRLAEEVRLEDSPDPMNGEPMVTVYYKGDMPPAPERGGRLIGGFEFYKNQYAPHLVKRAYAAAFAEHAARHDALGVPLFSPTHNRQAEQSYLKQRKLTSEEWLRIGGVVDIRRVIPTLRHQMRLGAELEFQRKVYEDGGMLAHNQPPDMAALEADIESTKDAIAAHLKWMTKNRIRVNQEIPLDPAMDVRRSRLERRAMQIEQLLDENGLPAHGLPSGWGPKDGASEILMGLQNDLRRLRRALWQVTNLNQPLDAVPQAIATANLQLRSLKDRLAALKLAKDQGWQELKGTGWGALNEYGRRPTWMRGDVFHAQAARAEEMSAWGAMWNAVLGHAKAAVTNENVVTQLANFTGNFGVNHAAGMAMPWMPHYYARALKTLREWHTTGQVTDPIAMEWLNDGGFDMDRLLGSSLPDVQKTLGEWIAEPGADAARRGESGGSTAVAVGLHQLVNLMSYVKESAPIVSKGFDAMRKAYTFSDQLSELALFLAARSGKGFSRGQLDRETAGRLVQDHYNQRDIPPVLRGKLGRRGLLPFASWIYKNLGAIPRHAMLRDATSWWADIPARIAAKPFSGKTAENVRSGVATAMSVGGLAGRYMLYHGLAHLAGRNLAGMTEQEYDKALDERSRGNRLKRMMMVPVWFDKDEVEPSKRVAFLDVSGLTAIGQILKLGQSAPNPADNWAMTIARMNPLGSAAVDFARNTDYYGKRLGQEETSFRQGTPNRIYQGLIRPFVPGTIRAFGEMDWAQHPGFDGIARALGIKIEKGDADLLTQALTFEAAKAGVDIEWVTSLKARTLSGKMQLVQYDIARLKLKMTKALRSGDIKDAAQLSEWIQNELENDAYPNLPEPGK